MSEQNVIENLNELYKLRKNLQETLKKIEHKITNLNLSGSRTKLETKSQTIIINARGIKYEVLLDSFERLTKSRLGKLRKFYMEDNYTELSRICDRYIPGSREFYFNRDPYMLNSILNFYQYGRLHMTESMCASFFRDEMDYWHLNEYAFELCCQINFLEKLDINEKLVEARDAVHKSINLNYEFEDACFPDLRRKLWNFLDNPNSSIYAKFLLGFSISTVLILVFNIVIRTMPDMKQPINATEEKGIEKASEKNSEREFEKISEKHGFLFVFDVIEISCFTWFVIEILARFIVCPNKIKFLKTPLNIIDIASIIPYFAWLIFSKYNNIPDSLKQMLSTLRIMLLFKMTRHSSSLKSFGLTLQKSFKELCILLFYLALSVIFFSSILYYCEKDTNPDFDSIPATFWWGIITMTTVGYGDVYPKTVLGKIFGGICAFCGVLIVSMPIGIISTNFSQVIEQQKREKHFFKIENRLNKMKKKIELFNINFCPINASISSRRDYISDV